MKIHLETMGCQMNRLDSELVAGALRAAGHEMVDDPKAADALLYNTCSVRRQAENKVYSRLGAAGQRKQHYPRLIIGVLGCMAQREGLALRKKYPQVDIICSPNHLEELVAMLAEAQAGRNASALDAPRRSGPVATAEEMDRLDLARDVAHTPSPTQAYVRVARGCDKFCSYCVVPMVRGAELCRDNTHIVEEVKRLVQAGRSEITLLGQTVNSYLYRDNGRSVSFADLLAEVAGVAGLRRLRFVTSHPLDFGDDILQAMRDLKNICPYIHVPAQSGSDAVLKRMNRKYTRSQYDELVDRARAVVPGVVLAGDFIVGFCGESEADHQASADLIRRSGYKNSFVFKYSPRPGTLAAKNLADDVPMEVKRRRNNELLAVQEEVGLAHHRQYIGQTVEVLVEGPSPRSDRQPKRNRPSAEVQLIGRTRGDHIVVFDGSPSLAGQYVDVTVTDATSLTLFAEKCQLVDRLTG